MSIRSQSTSDVENAAEQNVHMRPEVAIFFAGNTIVDVVVEGHFLFDQIVLQSVDNGTYPLHI